MNGQTTESETELEILRRERDDWKSEAERLGRLIGSLDLVAIYRQAAESWRAEAQRLAGQAQRPPSDEPQSPYWP